jgi:2-alkenal reductase
MNRTYRTNKNKHNWWLAAVFIAILSLLVSTIMGGVIGFVIATSLSPDMQQAALDPDASPVNYTAPTLEQEQVNIAQSPSILESQQLIEEVATVEAVKKVLPAVVTVFNEGQLGVGSGSGFFVDKEGFLVTNYHVVANARNLTVIYAQGGTAEATLVGIAPEFDLAVLKVEGPIPATVEWGDSGELPLGSHVIAIGSALGRYQNTVTAGMSGFNRELGSLRGLLQTDAAINSGNSGGPLINLAGQVIGINTMVVRGGMSEAEGLGFAIPSNVAIKVVQRLIETGEAKPSFLGIQYQELNPQLASEEGLNITYGALLQDVVSDTPAAQAGLRPGDVVVAINSQMIDDRHPLVSLLLEYVAGETITLDVLRDGEIFQTMLTLGERV